MTKLLKNQSADGTRAERVVLVVDALGTVAEVLIPGPTGLLMRLAGPVVRALKLALEIREQQRLLAPSREMATAFRSPLSGSFPLDVFGIARQQDQVIVGFV